MTASAQLSNRFPACDSECGPADVKPMLGKPMLGKPTLGATHPSPLTAPPAPLLPVAPALRAHVVPPAPRRLCGPVMRIRASQPNKVVRLVSAAVVTLAVVGGLGWLGQAPSEGIPTQTAVTRVGAGETLWDVAQRVAPKSDQRAVVERIQQLNGMASSAIQPGQELQVPAGR
jgi:LysM domain